MTLHERTGIAAGVVLGCAIEEDMLMPQSFFSAATKQFFIF